MREVTVGQWGRLQVHDPDDVPDGLDGAADSWRSDPRRRPAVLLARTMRLPYVAVWPTDVPPPPDGPLVEEDLTGVVLTQPVVHGCFACGAEVPGLLAEAGLPFFRISAGRHDWIRRCPSCDSHQDAARLGALLPYRGATSG